jgi:hypothetical protein
MSMKLSEYFENAKGIGVLATTDRAGKVNQAIYAEPLFLEKDDDTYLLFHHGKLFDPRQLGTQHECLVSLH